MKTNITTIEVSTCPSNATNRGAIDRRIECRIAAFASTLGGPPRPLLPIVRHSDHHQANFFVRNNPWFFRKRKNVSSASPAAVGAGVIRKNVEGSLRDTRFSVDARPAVGFRCGALPTLRPTGGKISRSARSADAGVSSSL